MSISPQSSATSEKKPTELPMQEGKGKWQLLPSGSRVTAVINLTKATVGAGALSVPYTLQMGGLVPGVALLCVLAMLTMLSLEMIVRAAHKTGKDTYEELVDLLFGRKPGYLFQAGMIGYCFGAAAAYMVIIFDIMNPVFVVLIGDNQSAWYGVILLDRFYFTVLLTVLVLLPVSLAKDIASIRYLTFVGVVGVVFLAVTAVYTVSRYGVSPSFEPEEALWAGSWSALMSAVNTYTFAFSNQPNVPEIYQSLSQRSPRKMRQVTVITILLCLSVYLTVAVAFYFTFGNDIQSSVINSLNPMVQAGDPMVAIAFILMGIAIMGTFPLNIYPVRVALLHSIDPPLAWRDVIGKVICLVTVAASFVVAIALPDVTVILGLVGAMSGSVICFMGPAAFNLKISEGPVFSKENWTYLLLLSVGILTFVLGTFVAVLDVVKYYTA